MAMCYGLLKADAYQKYHNERGSKDPFEYYIADPVLKIAHDALDFAKKEKQKAESERQKEPYLKN